MIAYADCPTYFLIVLLLAGLWLLCYGGDWLASGSASLALKFKINPVIVGLTVVSIATSMPELLTTFVATANGSPGLAIGNILGSNICNIGLILGIAAMISPLQVQQRLIKQESPVLLSLTLLFMVMCAPLFGDGRINRLEGGILLVLTVAYLVFLVREARKGPPELVSEVAEEVAEPIKRLRVILGLILLGGLALAIGAELIYQSSVVIARRLEVSETLIGLTIVAVGTSLPELAASIAAALKKHSDIVAGNIVGSNIFNMLLIGGGVGSVFELEVEPQLFLVEFPSMLLLTLLLWGAFYTDRAVTRREGGCFVIGYVAIMLLSYGSQSFWGS